MSKYVRIALASSAWLLASCSTPFFADRLTRIDWSGPPVAGTIAVSPPKMYRRESLINERRDEVQWVKEQLDASKTALFEPELVRETEQIKQMALALGLTFNPADAVNYRRDARTGEIQQQIEEMKLQIMLDQLRRDANLTYAGFPAQTTPVNADLGKLNSSVKAATSPAQTAAAGKLLEAIDTVKAELATRLGAEAKPAVKANATVNPADLFRDRSALRDLLKSASNAASMDDLHDHGGSALIRLNFQAMVLPDRERTRALGVVQMTVMPPVFDEETVKPLYRSWLDHFNSKLNRFDGVNWTLDSDQLFSKAADNFDLVTYQFAQAGAIAAAQALASAPACTPLAPGVVTSAPDGCGTLVFAVPKFKGKSTQEGAYSILTDYLKFSALGDTPETSSEEYIEAKRRIINHTRQVVPSCALPAATPPAKGEKASGAWLLLTDILLAQQRAASGEAYARIERQAQRMLRKAGAAPVAESPEARVIAIRTGRAHELLSTFEAAAYAGCDAEARKAFRRSGPVLYVPPDFLSTVVAPPRVAVYEIGPREQMQQVSTVSRVANSLSLALALAGSAPQTGLGASAAAGYSRQALGRAAALERVPGLIGYSTTDVTFGWVIAPKAVLDPKGTVQLEQTPRALDLSVELSVPGWWPSFSISTVTSWAPEVGAITGGTVQMGKPKSFVVPMTPNYADLDELTTKLQSSDATVVRSVVLDEAALTKQFVAACRATSLYLRGANIWRANSVVLEGHLLDEYAITVAPDMSGILVAVPPLDELIGDINKSKIGVAVFTRHGDASAEVDYVKRPVPDGCKPPDKPSDPNATVVTAISPTEFKGGMPLEFTAQGSNLDKVQSVLINNQKGTITVAGKDGKTLKMKFTAKQTGGLAASRTIPLSFYIGEKKVAERNIENRP